MTEFELKPKRISAWQYQAPPRESESGILLDEQAPGWLVQAHNAGKIKELKHAQAGWYVNVKLDFTSVERWMSCVNGMWITCDRDGALGVIGDAELELYYDKIV